MTDHYVTALSSSQGERGLLLAVGCACGWAWADVATDARLRPMGEFIMHERENRNNNDRP